MTRAGSKVARWTAAAAFVSGLAFAPGARADEASRLFEEGKQMMSAGRYPAACDKLAESLRLLEGTGTLLALAICHENSGRVGTAYHEYKRVIPLARSQGREDRAQVAAERLMRLEPMVPSVRLLLSPQTVDAPGLVVRCDGRVLDAKEWRRPLRLDPGAHTFQAEAPGRSPFRASLVVEANRSTDVAIDLPTQGTSAAGVTTTTPSRPGEWKGTAGWVTLGLGGALLLTGSYFGVRALSASSDAEARCPSTLCSDFAGVSAGRDAKSYATVANVTLVGAAVALGVGAYLVLDARAAKAKNAQPSARLTPLLGVGPQTATVAVAGAWP